MKKDKKELVIYYIKNNFEIMCKFADLRHDLESDLSLVYKLGFKKSNDNIGVIYIKAEQYYLQQFINRNKRILKKYGSNIVIA